MIRLFPHATREQRLRHTIKHYYSLAEYFWHLSCPFPTWLAEWHVLRAAEALPQLGWAPIEPGTLEDETVLRGDGHYLAIAQQALAHALAHDQVRPTRTPGRQSFLGEAGVIVIAAPARNGYWLVTCFRVVPGWGGTPRSDPGHWEAAALATVERLGGAIHRSAVRRRHRDALYRTKGQGAADEEE